MRIWQDQVSGSGGRTMGSNRYATSVQFHLKGRDT
jgi:hypothetical protein